MSNIKFAELDFSDGYQLRLEHQYNSAFDLHTLCIKRKYTGPHDNNKEVYSDIKFNLDTEHFIQFCNFFKMIGD